MSLVSFNIVRKEDNNLLSAEIIDLIIQSLESKEDTWLCSLRSAAYAHVNFLIEYKRTNMYKRTNKI